MYSVLLHAFKKLVMTDNIDFVSRLWATNHSLENSTLAGYNSFIFYLKAAYQGSLCNCLIPFPAAPSKINHHYC